MKTASTEREAIVAEVAAKLAKEQREWILAMPTIPTSISEGDWDEIPQLYVKMEPDEYVLGYHHPIYYGRKEWFGSAHAHKPVGTEWYLSAQLNETGLAIRSYIKDQDHGRA